MTRTTREKYMHLALLVGLLLGLTALVAPALEASIWIDERRTLNYAGAAPVYGPAPISESIAKLAQNYWQSPGYFLMLWGWWRVMGAQVFMMRLPSLFFGLLAIAGTYGLGRRYFSREVGLYAALLMSLSAFYVHFMHEMRTYSLLVLAGVLLAWAYGWLISGSPRRWLGVLVFAASVALMLYTHFFGVFPLAALGLYHLVFQRKNPAFWLVMLGFVMGGLAFLPWVPVFLGGVGRSTHDARLVDNMGLMRGVSDLLHFFANGAVLLAAGLFLLAARRPAGEAGRFLWFMLLVSFGLVWGATRFFKAFTEIKYIIYYWPMLALLAGLGLEKLRAYGLAPVVVLGLWAAAFAGSLLSEAEQARIHPWATPPLRDLAAALDGLTTPDDALLFLSPPGFDEVEISDSMLAYYTHGMPLAGVDVIDDTYATTDVFWAGSIREATEGAGRVLVSYEEPGRTWRYGPLAQSILPELSYSECGVVLNTPDFGVNAFARQPDNPMVVFPVGDGENAVEIYLLADPIVSAGYLHLAVGWAYPPEAAPPANAHSVGLHVEDADGTLILQADEGISAVGFGCQHHRLPLDDLPPGEYTLRATVYRWQDGSRLPSQPPADDNRPVVGQFTRP